MPLPLPGIIAAIASVLMALQTIGGTPYLDLVERYHAGDYEAAVHGLAELREGRSWDRVTESLESLVGPTSRREPRSLATSMASQQATAKLWAVAFPAAAALHLETGFALMKAGDFAAGRDHLHIAHQIVDYQRFGAVMKVRPDLRTTHNRFARDIHLGVLWAFQADPLLDRMLQHLQHLRDELPGDGEVALALGAYEEYQSSSVVIRALKPPTALMASGPYRQNAQQMRLKNAEKYYREALKVDETLAEAHVRLGRILQQRGMLAEARTQLEMVFAQPDAEPAMRYLASMFLVNVLDAQGQTAASLARARDLAARYPECQSAHLALASALEARGQRIQARAALWPLWKEEASRACVDPWWSYYMGQTWRISALVLRLRDRVRGLE